MSPSQKKRQNWSAQCDKVFAWLVRTSGPCARCGTEFNLQCAHGFSRSYRATRWDFRNAFPLCASDHMYFTHRPIEWDNWLRIEWGLDLYDEIRALALSHARPDTKALLVELRELERERLAA